MRTLVTGVTGRIGTRFLPRILYQVDHVRALVRRPEQGEPLRRRDAEVLVGDLRDPETRRRAVDGMDSVVHLAAAFRAVDGDEAMATNHTATVELATAAVRAGAHRFVFASTNLVYGPGRGRPATEEDEPQPPARAYPTSKAAAEAALRNLQPAGDLDLRIVRLAFVYGEGDPHLAEAMPWAAREWPAHKRLHLVHHADVDQALLRALRMEGLSGRIYNVADDAPVTTAELHELNGEPLPERLSGLPLDDPWEGIVNTGRARSELLFRPIYPSVYTARDAGTL